jgi:hypothetical protein
MIVVSDTTAVTTLLKAGMEGLDAQLCASDSIGSSRSTCGVVHPLRGQPLAF